MHETDRRQAKAKEDKLFLLDAEDIPMFDMHDDKFMLKSLDWLDKHKIKLTGKEHSTDELRLQLLLHSGVH